MGDDDVVTAPDVDVSPEVEQWVLDHADEVLVSPDSPWSSRRHLQREARKGDDVTAEQVAHAVDVLAARRELVTWHGLCARCTVEKLTEIIEYEIEKDVKRKILIGKCNRLRQHAKTEQDSES